MLICRGQLADVVARPCVRIDGHGAFAIETLDERGRLLELERRELRQRQRRATQRWHAHLLERREFRLLLDRRTHHDRVLLAGRVLERPHADAGHREPHGAIELRGLHSQLLRLARVDAQLEVGARDVQRILDVARARRGLDDVLHAVATAAR